MSVLLVLQGGEHAGALEQRRDGRLTFTYLDDWRHTEGATPLSLSMPLARAVHGHDTVAPFLWGLLPDNGDVLGRWGRDFQVSPANPFALLRHTGEDCAGAVQFVDPERVDAVVANGGVQPLTTDDVAAHLRALRVDPTAWHLATGGGQFSLAGAQAKLALLHDEDGWGRPYGRVPTTHILKPAIEGFDDHDLNEHLCLDAAHRVGLLTAESHVETFGDERAIVLTRYDRIRTDEGWRRIHQEDLCQALAVLPASKYQHEGGPSPERILTLLRTELAKPAADEAVTDLLEALVLNWLLAGTDAHAKNYSLLLSGRQVRMAPLYDVASILAYPETYRDRLLLAMKIGGEYRLRDIRARHWDRLATSAGVPTEWLRERALTMAQELPQALADAAAVPAVRDLRSRMPARLVDAVSAWAADCATTLRGAD